jgi:hypothetical protein
MRKLNLLPVFRTVFRMMRKSTLIIFAMVVTFTMGTFVTSMAQNQPQKEVKKKIFPGEQAPPADPGQRNFGGTIPPAGTPGQQRPPRQPRPEPQIRTVSLDSISMSDPFIYADTKSHTYYLTGTGGRLYKSKDLKMWTGPYPIIDLSGTWMNGLFVAAAEIHHIGNKYYYAGTWSDHSHLIQQVPRRYNVPRNQTQL